MAKTLQKKNIRNVPSHIKGAILEYANERDISMADLVVEILNGHFRGERKHVVVSGEPALGDQLHIYISPTLAGQIWRRSRKTGETESSVVLSIVAEFFGLPYEPVQEGKGVSVTQLDDDQNVERTELIYQRRNEQSDLQDADRRAQARSHFPHLSPSVAPRESDEHPTFWEDQ